MQKYLAQEFASLAAQMARGPKRLVLRQLRSIDFVLSVLQSEHSYPFDFVLHALTGYRSSGRTNAENPESRLLSADTIRQDLITLAEDISNAAEIEVGVWPERLFSVADLAKRFDVSSKTIFRWHRRGLVGWRLCYADRRVRLAFPEHCVRQFVAYNAGLVNRGSSFSQLSGAEREQIVAWARRLADNGHRTVNAVAKVIAAETNRAVETIRLILKSYDDAHPRAGVFNRPKLKVGANDERLKIWEAYVDGAGIAALAQRFGRPPAQIYAIITEMRGRDLKARTIEFVDSDEFRARNADELIIEDAHALGPNEASKSKTRVPADLPPYLRQLFYIPLLTAAGERALFRKFNYLKYKAVRLRDALDPESVKARELDRIEDLLSQAERVKSQITQANLRLVVSIAKRHATPFRDFFEIISDGNMSLMRAVERFDYSRGFKFSTYASWAIMKNYARTIPEQRQHRDRYQTGRDELLEVLSSPGPEEHETDYLPALRSKVEQMLTTLDERESEILRQRFGLDDHGEPQTLQQIGERFGVSKERIRQLESRAMSKLRSDFSEQVEQLLGA